MDILFLLVPLSVLLALGVMGVLAWAVWSGQFEELDSEGERIFQGSPLETGLPLPPNDADLIQIKAPEIHPFHTQT
jgi:cbb3-type cytochrome oxidase maturation protein